MSGIDEAKGLLTQDTNGSYRYQMHPNNDGNLSNTLSGRKLSDALKAGSGKARVTVGSNNSAADEIFQDLESKSYKPDSERDIGFRAVSATGNHHTHNSEIKDDSLVTVGKLQAPAKSLYEAGILTKDSEGHYQIPGTNNNNKKN